jgi:hypothetical protein
MFIIHAEKNNTEGLLGLWRDIPSGSLSFSESWELKEETGCLISLPDDPLEADASISRLETDLQTKIHALSKGGEFLRHLPVNDSLSFGLSSSSDPDSAEIRLQQHIAWLKSGGKNSVSFGWGFSDKYSETASGFETFIRKIPEFLKPVLCVETRIQENLFACTRAGIGGDMKTLWHLTDGDFISLHQRNVSFASDSRTALFQLLGQMMTGAAALAVRFSLPGGAITALPAAWRYVQDVMAQAASIPKRAASREM